MGSFEKNCREAVSFIMIRVWLLLGLCAVLASGRHYHYEQSRRFIQPQAEPHPEPHSEPHYPHPEPHSEPHYPHSETNSVRHYPHPEPHSEPHYPYPEPHSEPHYPYPEPHSEPHYPHPEPHSEPEPYPEPEAYPEPHAEPYQIVYHYPQARPSYYPQPYAEPYPEPEPYQQMQPVNHMQPVFNQMQPVFNQMQPVYNQQPAQYHQRLVYTSAPVYRQLVRLVSSHTPQRLSYPTYPTQYIPGRTGRFIIPFPDPMQPIQFLNDMHSNTKRNGRLFFPFPYMNPMQPLHIDLNNEQADTIVSYVQSYTDPFLGTDGADIGIDGDEGGSEEEH